MIDINFDYSKQRAKIIEDGKLKKPDKSNEDLINKDVLYKHFYCMPARNNNKSAEYKEFNKSTQEYIDEAIEKSEQIKEICLVSDIIDIYNGKYKTYEDYIKHVTSKEHEFVYAGQNMILVIRESTFNYLFCKRNLKTKREVESE